MLKNAKRYYKSFLFTFMHFSVFTVLSISSIIGKADFHLFDIFAES